MTQGCTTVQLKALKQSDIDFMTKITILDEERYIHILFFVIGFIHQGVLMTKPIPTIQKYMTTVPFSVEKDSSLLDAAKKMQELHIRHLPVLYQGKIEGILSSTDVNLIRSLSGVRIENMKVYDCFTSNPYTVSPETKLDVVLDEMAEKKYGCVLVADNEHLVGIFTWIDALKASKNLLETRLK